MTRMTADARRALLIDAAIVAMGRDGVANTTTRSIVAEAGMQVGVFHYCFRSKDELVAEVLRTINNRSFAAASEILSLSTDPAELISLALDAYWKHVEANADERMLIFELTQYSLRTPGQEHGSLEQYQTFVDGMVAFLNAVAEIGKCRWNSDVEVVARFVLATLQGTTLQWLVIRDGAIARQILEQLGNYLVQDTTLDC